MMKRSLCSRSEEGVPFVLVDDNIERIMLLPSQFPVFFVEKHIMMLFLPHLDRAKEIFRFRRNPQILQVGRGSNKAIWRKKSDEYPSARPWQSMREEMRLWRKDEREFSSSRYPDDHRKSHVCGIYLWHRVEDTLFCAM